MLLEEIPEQKCVKMKIWKIFLFGVMLSCIVGWYLKFEIAFGSYDKRKIPAFMNWISKTETGKINTFSDWCRKGAIAETSRNVCNKSLMLDTRPNCSRDVLYNFISENLQLPGCGAWQTTRDFAKGGFQPNMCHYDRNVPRDLNKCINRQTSNKPNSYRVVIFGDSHGKRLSESVITLLTRNLIGAKYKCSQIKVDSPKLIKMSYFSPKPQELFIMQRGCSGCSSRKMFCRVSKPKELQGNKTHNTQQPKTVILEYLTLEQTLDYTINILKKPVSKKCKVLRELCMKEKHSLNSWTEKENKNQTKCFQEYPECVQYKNTLDFFVSHYLKDDIPDLAIFYSPFHHDINGFKYNISQATICNYTKDNLDILKKHWFNKTKIFLLGSHKMNPAKKPEKWKNKLFEGIYDCNQQVYAFDKKLENILVHEILKHPQMFLPFFDLYSLSHEISNKWNTDGVHMIGSWYLHLASYIFQTLCSK